MSGQISALERICPEDGGGPEVKWFAISEKEIRKLQIVHEKVVETFPTLTTIAEQILLNVMGREIEYPPKE